MNYEERYYELREAMDRTYDIYCVDPCYFNEVKHSHALDNFYAFCTQVLEKLMEENSDILARLK